ncbi:hypothetical protein [Corynebacterium sphenisci]|uniref:hypothetical protein n=1 Tax=Corynebacterium sphenisci TaxID=191493 RepID=UPI0026DF6045|nr:hypothetical protein [Corynebacterium sphenisci]MDO5730798.1 hypothetical protein [Corynebacterium sphenisci]
MATNDPIFVHKEGKLEITYSAPPGYEEQTERFENTLVMVYESGTVVIQEENGTQIIPGHQIRDIRAFNPNDGSPTPRRNVMIC